MFSLFVKYLRSLTMKSQIILFNLITLVIVLSVGWINYYVQTEIFQAISSSSLSQILQTQDQDQIGFIAQNIGQVIELKFMAVLLQIEQISQFYKFYQLEKQHLISNQKMDPCLTRDQYMKNNLTYSIPKFCYQATGVSDYITIPINETEVLLLHDFISFLNHYNLVINVPITGKIQIASISSTKYFSQFPTALLIPSYDITKRYWFENHIQKNIIDPNIGFVFSPIHDAFRSQVKEMSVTNSIYNHGQMIGIIRQGLTIDDNLIPTIPYNVLLVDQDGLVIYFNIEQLRNKTDYFYIYEENITGFNKTDWQDMIQFSNLDQKIILVLENKLQKEKVNIYSLEVLKNNFTLVVYTNITTKLDSQSKSEAIKESSFLNFTIFLFAQIFLGIAAIFIQVFVLFIVFKPLKQFSTIIQQYTLSQGNNINSEIFKMINNKKESTDAVSTLQNKVLNFSQILSERQERKCETCRIWESFSYNQQELEIDLHSIRYQFKNLKNGQREFNPKILKIVKLGLN